MLSYDFVSTQHEPFVVISQFLSITVGSLLRLFVSAWPADDLRDMVSRMALINLLSFR